MNSQDFKTRHCHTLQTDPETQQTYIKLPINDFNELVYMQESLLDGILLLSQLEKRHFKSEQMQSITYWLCKLLMVSYPNTEIDGLSEWLTSK